jgi:ABC-type amino acid transport substrate-binding protein
VTAPAAWRRLPRWLLAAAGLVVLLALAGAAGAIWRGDEDEAWERIQASGEWHVATDASYPPFSAVDANGNLFGFDVDLAEAIGARWGVRAVFENLTYDALLGSLVVGRSDAVISAYVPQPERMADVAFTRSYFVAGTVAVIDAARGQLLRGDPAAWAQGQRLAVEYGSGADALTRQWARQRAGITATPLPTAAEALAAVAAGEADAALVDAVSAYEHLQAQPGLALAGPPLEPEPYAIAVSIKSRALLRLLEETLIAMEADGSLPALREKWFGPAAR